MPCMPRVVVSVDVGTESMHCVQLPLTRMARGAGLAQLPARHLPPTGRLGRAASRALVVRPWRSCARGDHCLRPLSRRRRCALDFMATNSYILLARWPASFSLFFCGGRRSLWEALGSSTHTHRSPLRLRRRSLRHTAAPLPRAPDATRLTTHKHSAAMNEAGRPLAALYPVPCTLYPVGRRRLAALRASSTLPARRRLWAAARSSRAYRVPCTLYPALLRRRRWAAARS